jgi:hypothetical protein
MHVDERHVTSGEHAVVGVLNHMDDIIAVLLCVTFCWPWFWFCGTSTPMLGRAQRQA